MGSGAWSSNSFASYTTATKRMSADDFEYGYHSNQEVFKSKHIAPELKPYNVIRECCDSEEHPETLPVILALDVTGSMGQAAVKVAQKLNAIMTSLYESDSVKDIEFCIMGIGDLAYDSSPIQISQFESDIRIAEQLDKIYFEFGGGGNGYESYTAAWYMGTKHCSLDCWKRGQKGIIITLGDEGPNPYLPMMTLKDLTGDTIEDEDQLNTSVLYQQVKEKFDVFHISVNDNSSSYSYHQHLCNIDRKWKELLGENYYVSTLDNLNKVITDIIEKSAGSTSYFTASPYIFGAAEDEDEISW